MSATAVYHMSNCTSYPHVRTYTHTHTHTCIHIWVIPQYIISVFVVPPICMYVRIHTHTHIVGTDRFPLEILLQALKVNRFRTIEERPKWRGCWAEKSTWGPHEEIEGPHYSHFVFPVNKSKRHVEQAIKGYVPKTDVWWCDRSETWKTCYIDAKIHAKAVTSIPFSIARSPSDLSLFMGVYFRVQEPEKGNDFTSPELVNSISLAQGRRLTTTTT